MDHSFNPTGLTRSGIMKQISLFLLIIISLYLVSQVDSSLTKDYLPGEGDSDEDIIPKRKNPQTTRKTKQLRTKDLEKKKEDRDKKHLPNDYISKKVVDSESDEIVSQKKRTTHHKKRTTPVTALQSKLSNFEHVF